MLIISLFSFRFYTRGGYLWQRHKAICLGQLSGSINILKCEAETQSWSFSACVPAKQAWLSCLWFVAFFFSCFQIYGRSWCVERTCWNLCLTANVNYLFLFSFELTLLLLNCLLTWFPCNYLFLSVLFKLGTNRQHTAMRN